MSEATCPRCGRTTWQRHGGMGGRVVPDAVKYCPLRDSLNCRVAAAGRRAGIDECLERAKQRARIVFGSANTEIDWTDVDAAAEAAKGER